MPPTCQASKSILLQVVWLLGYFAWSMQPSQKKKKAGEREDIALIFSNCVFIAVESYSSNYLLENSLQKKKIVRWSSGEIPASSPFPNPHHLSLFPFLSLSPPPKHINSPSVPHVHFLSISYLAQLSLDHVSNSS